MLKYLLTITALLVSLSLSAQSQSPWEIGLQIGTSSVGGDMIENDIVFLNQPSIAGGLHVRRRLGSALALRAHILYGGIKSDDSKSEDADQAARGFSSDRNIVEPGLVLEFEPFAKKRFSENNTFKKILSPYIYGGVSYGIWSNEQSNFNGMVSDLITADRENDDNSAIFFPVGLGLKYYISPRTSLGT